MHKLAVFLFAALAAAGCATQAAEPVDTWNPDPDSYRYVIYHQEGGEWEQSSLTNEPDAKCPYDEPWRDPITAVRIEDRETGETETIDCEESS